MIIGVNGNEANVAHRVGVGQYAFELLKRFPKEGVVVYLEDEPRPDMPDLRYEVFGPKKLWTLTGLQRKLLVDPPDVLFTPTHYAPLILPMPSVISIMDLAFEKFPHFFKPRDLYQLKYWSRLSARQATKIITISENSKQDIVEIYHIPEKKIAVTYPGYDRTRFHQQVKGVNKYGGYLLFLGTLQPRKNIERLVAAYQQLETDCKLVIAGMRNEGRGGWMNEGIKSSEKIILTGYVPDAEVPILMANAKAYVLPSLYEGFGIPAIEAMACGTPVVVSRVSSLPEICGEAATYIEDPYSVESIKSALEAALKNGDKKIKLGLEWVKRYNWENTAKETLEILKNVQR
jgi:glycosyltransferase involved in cell wall biosynthesis